MDPLETIYLSEQDKIEPIIDGKPIKGRELYVHCSTLVEDLGTKYLVYRDLRARGLVTKTNPPFVFKTYPRGSIPGKEPSDLWVDIISERGQFSLQKLFEEARHISGINKRFILAVVDEEADLTYYEVELRSPKGKLVCHKGPEGKGKGVLSGDKVFIWDQDFAQFLHNYEFFGKFVDSALGLSLFEAYYLIKKGMLEIEENEGKVSPEKFLEHAKSLEPKFDIIQKVYTHMKSRGLIVKTGFKYGSHFRAYKDDPETNHSPYLIWAAKADYVSTWPEVSRAIRLAHTVNKDFLIGAVNEDSVEYLGISRVKP